MKKLNSQLFFWLCLILIFMLFLTANDKNSKPQNNKQMDDIYKGLNREQKIQMVYNLTLQNTNGRETHEEMYKLGIEACYDELIGDESEDTNK